MCSNWIRALAVCWQNLWILENVSVVNRDLDEAALMILFRLILAFTVFIYPEDSFSSDMANMRNGHQVTRDVHQIMQSHIWYLFSISCRVWASFHAPSVALEWAATASSAVVASTGCTGNAVGSSAWQKTLTTDVQGAGELYAPWMADHRRKSRLDLTSLRW